MSKDFLNHLRYEKRYSEHTVVSYEIDLRQLKEFLDKSEEEVSLQDARPMHLRNWIVSLLEGEISPRSVNRKISTLKTYFKYLKKLGLRTDNPMSTVISPKTSKRLPEFVEQRQMEGLFSVEGLFSDDFEGLRDRLLIHLFYSTGLRLSELIEIRIKDFSALDSTIRVLGKRNKERIIPLGNGVLTVMEEYLSAKKKEGLTESEYLLVRNGGQKLYEKFVYRKVNQYLGKVTTLKKRSPHVLRHTFATHMLNNGADIHAIKEILGHSSLAATQVYTHNTIEKLKSIHRQAHPKG